MWQRIQTLYLAISTILIGSLFFVNMATIIGDQGQELSIKLTEKMVYLLFLIMIFTGNGTALFSFKVRLLQLRVVIIMSLLLLGFQVWLGFDFFQNKDVMVFSFTMVFPIVAMILNLLAARAIGLDEAMVQSSHRLRSGRRR